MGISDLMQWWEDSQLRVLVLSSLIFQYLLAIAAPLRKRYTHPLFRFFTWLAYLGSDAVAIYALATLFNRQKKQEWVTTHHKRANLEVVWAPIILMHLGGQDSITAYNLEDNELWRRHLLTTVSQVTVAIYVFCKSWSGERRLLQTAILMFVPGIIKCFQKPRALRKASINSLASYFSSDKPHNGGDIKSLREYVRRAKEWFQNGYQLNTDIPPSYDRIGVLVDFVQPYDARIQTLKLTVSQGQVGRAHALLKTALSVMFDMLYTKLQVADAKTCSGNLVGFATQILPFAAIGLFHKSHKEGYDVTDIKVTYTLLCCTAALEHYIALVPIVVTYFSLKINEELPWPDQVAQYNLKSNRKHTWRRKLASFVGSCKQQSKLSSDITSLVYAHLLEGWTDYIEDPATYRSFSDLRGEWTLQKECGQPMDNSILDWHLSRPFDESVFVWHLSTELCFSSTVSGEATNMSDQCRKISNYMLYLLFFNPEMLMGGTRLTRSTTAYDKLIEMLNDNDKLSLHGTEFKRAKGEEGAFIHDACALSQKLKDVGTKEDDAKMWKVIQGVWVEMLCFSASRCRGHLHAKNLSKGGEYLSYVWLLHSFMGLQTLGERLQRTELPEHENKDATTTATDTATGDAIATATTPVLETHTGDDNNV